VRPLQLLTLADISAEGSSAKRDSGSGTGSGIGGRNGVIVQGEEDERLEEYRMHTAAAQVELKDAIGQLSYVKNLAVARLFAEGGDNGLEGGRAAEAVGAEGVESTSKSDGAGTGASGGTEETDCVVCMESLHECECMVTPCGHSFHKECVEWLMHRGRGRYAALSAPSHRPFKCPVCRRLCDMGDMLSTGKLVKGGSGPAGDVSTSSASPATSSAPIVNRTDGHILQARQEELLPVRGQWGTKVSAVVRDLFPLVASGEKAILFSQWDQMLDIVSAALTANGICHEKIITKKTFDLSLVRFTCDPSVTVLLLPLKSGAQGLTVVEANHVFFMEPMLNLEQEQQAMNRVHRIGQTRRTYIHRYIVENTVETKLHDLYVKRCNDLTSGPKAKGRKRSKDDQSSLTLRDIREFLGERQHGVEQGDIGSSNYMMMEQGA
jgi:hypothetical protein